SAAPKLAIGEALLFHNGIGGKRKEARLRYLSRYWMNRLKDVPKVRFNTSFDPSQSCAIANVHIDGTNPEAVTKYLFDKHHIFAVPIMHDEFQGIRITPNVYTTLGELDRFCEQMEKIARKGLPAYRQPAESQFSEVANCDLNGTAKTGEFGVRRLPRLVAAAAG